MSKSTSVYPSCIDGSDSSSLMLSSISGVFSWSNSAEGLEECSTDSPSVVITANTSPTATTAFSSNRFSSNMPDTSAETSVSTLSVAISTIGSSKEIESPISLSHLVTVASATLSPILGNFKKYCAM